jgi:hypothetical protein
LQVTTTRLDANFVQRSDLGGPAGGATPFEGFMRSVAGLFRQRHRADVSGSANGGNGKLPRISVVVAQAGREPITPA